MFGFEKGGSRIGVVRLFTLYIIYLESGPDAQDVRDKVRVSGAGPLIFINCGPSRAGGRVRFPGPSGPFVGRKSAYGGNSKSVCFRRKSTVKSGRRASSRPSGSAITRERTHA
jgi:hypothetical protein